MARTPPEIPPGTEILDATTTFPQGINSGIAPELLPKSQLAYASNGTVRNSYITHRPPFHDRGITFQTPGQQSAFEQGLWQGACWAQPPTGTPEALVAQIKGRLWYIAIIGNVATCTELTIPGDPNPPTNPQCWAFQAENWVVLNDGASIPIFLDLSTLTARRSLVQSRTTLNANFVAPNDFVIPPIDGVTTVNVTFSAVTGLTVGQIVNFWGVGQMQVTNVGADPVITFINVNALPVGGTVVAPGTATWSTAISELPPGRMGAYWRGRIWLSLTDGIQFLAGDIVGGPSGSLADNFVDAILKISENTYLAGGGNFRVPGNVDRIQAIVPIATLDASMGQGQLAVLTNTTVFTVNATVDRLTWQAMQNPILTESLIGTGGQGQNSTIPANGDTLFRSTVGIQSLILGRRDFDYWGQSPQSREMNRILPLDNLSLLPFGSAVVFENRFLLTAAPTVSAQGVYHPALVALNFDPISSLAGKAPSVYDGTWKGLNTLQIVTGTFAKTPRCFVFNLDTIASPNRIKLTEILSTPPDVLNEATTVTADEIYDDGVRPISMLFESPTFFKGQDPRTAPYLRLLDGEIAVDLLQGEVLFQVWFRPDQHPCFVPWIAFSQCSTLGPNAQPQFRPRMGFGRPDVSLCDPSTNRPLCEGYQFQVRVVVTGHCRVRSVRLLATTIPQQKFAPLTCAAICPPAL